MFCNKCGREISENAKFCEGCGEKTEMNIQNQTQPSILSNLLGVAISIVFICFSFYYFNLADKTAHTFNGISVKRVPEFMTYGGVLLGVGLLIAIIAINNWYRKKR